MRKSKYSEHQIIAALKQAENGVAVKDICRELGITSAALREPLPPTAALLPACAVAHGH